MSATLRNAARGALRFIALFSAVLAFADTAHAQVTTGSIQGIVQDPSGAVVPGVNVVATKVETGTTRVEKSSGKGNFSFNSMEAGTYSLKFTIDGFKTKQVDHLVLNTGSTLDVPPVSLETGDVSETVTVQAQGAQTAAICFLRGRSTISWCADETLRT